MSATATADIAEPLQGATIFQYKELAFFDSYFFIFYGFIYCDGELLTATI